MNTSQVDQNAIRKNAADREEKIKELETAIRKTREYIDTKTDLQKQLVSLAFRDMGVPQRTVGEWAGISPTKVRRWASEMQE